MKPPARAEGLAEGSADSLRLFATPIHVFALAGMESVNAELVERLVGEGGQAVGLERSNVGGWHSPADLARRPEPVFHALMQAIVGSVDRVLGELASEARLPG